MIITPFERLNEQRTLVLGRCWVDFISLILALRRRKALELGVAPSPRARLCLLMAGTSQDWGVGPHSPICSLLPGPLLTPASTSPPFLRAALFTRPTRPFFHFTSVPTQSVPGSPPLHLDPSFTSYPFHTYILGL